MAKRTKYNNKRNKKSLSKKTRGRNRKNRMKGGGKKKAASAARKTIGRFLGRGPKATLTRPPSGVSPKRGKPFVASSSSGPPVPTSPRPPLSRHQEYEKRAEKWRTTPKSSKINRFTGKNHKKQKANEVWNTVKQSPKGKKFQAPKGVKNVKKDIGSDGKPIYTGSDGNPLVKNEELSNQRGYSVFEHPGGHAKGPRENMKHTIKTKNGLVEENIFNTVPPPQTMPVPGRRRSVTV